MVVSSEQTLLTGTRRNYGVMEQELLSSVVKNDQSDLAQLVRASKSDAIKGVAVRSQTCALLWQHSCIELAGVKQVVQSGTLQSGLFIQVLWL